MPRKSPVHYIAPNVLSITPNCNGSFNDLAVTVVKGGKVKVFSEGVKELATQDAYYQEWTFSGRNRRLNDVEGTTEFTIYLRLPKNDKSGGYLVFAPKDKRGDTWVDKYCTVTMNGLTKQGSTGTDARVLDHNNWYIRIGDVSLPEGGKRTVTLDLGILGTDQFNNEWNLDPDDMPLRLELSGTIDGIDAGPTPYVAWGKSLILRAKLVEGWVDTDVERFRLWEIRRNTGDATADASWPSEGRARAFGKSGNIELSHARGEGDDFNNAFSSIFTVIAWGVEDSDSSSSSSDSGSSSSTGDLVPLAMGSITVMAETVEKFELELSTNVVSYDPTTDVYNPIEGVKVHIRATDQRSNVFKMTRGQVDSAGLSVEYAVTDSEDWTRLPFRNPSASLAEAVIPISFFQLQQNVNVRIMRSISRDSDSSSSGGSGTAVEVYRTNIAFVRNGEDSKEKEYIYLRSKTAITFGSLDSPHPLPALIPGGEVEPVGAATGLDTDKNQDGWVPEGWWDEMQGTSEEYHYEYAAYREYIKDGGSSSSDSSSSGDATQRGGHWGEFSRPVIWSYYGDDAVTYRCRWTLDGSEIFQLKASYTGTFRGTLPLVARLMKRKGNNPEGQVTGASVVTVHFDGLGNSLQPEHPYNVDNPEFIISTDEHPEFIPYLSNKDLSGINITFTTGGEAHDFSIPMIREADEDSVKDTIDVYGSTLFLSKLHDDVAAGIIAFLQGLKFGGANSRYGVTVGSDGNWEAVFQNVIFDSILKSLGADPRFIGGNGIHMDGITGHIATDSLDVRGWMRVMELVINRLQLMESDYSFTEGATAEHFVVEPNGNYLTITVHKEHDNDYLPFYPGDILYAKVNDLLPKGQVPDGHTATTHGSYYTVWLRVVSTDFTDNTMVCVPYDGRDARGLIVPGGVNFTPLGRGITGPGTTFQDFYMSYVSALQAEYAEHPDGYDKAMNFTRHGNVADGVDPETGQHSDSILSSQKLRQTAWVLSTTDKNITMYWHVNKPIIDISNYAAVLGIIPGTVQDHLGGSASTADWTKPSLWVDTIFYDHYHQANFPAKVDYKDRGQWLQSPTATYTGESGTRTPDGTLSNSVAVALGWSGSSPVTLVSGQQISEPYHASHITRAVWLNYRFQQAYANMSDEELYGHMTGDWKTDLETSRVWNGNKLWECLADGTTEEPEFGCNDWQVISGDTLFKADFEEDYQLYDPDNFKGSLTVYVMWGTENLTDKILQQDIVWSRYTEDKNGNPRTASDTIWNTNHAFSEWKTGRKTLTLSQSDLNSESEFPSLVRFRCEVTLRDGANNEVYNDIVEIEYD